MTRHNMGALVVQKFAHQLGLGLKVESRFNAKTAKGIKENQIVHLVVPLTYMNLSGTAVRHYADYFKIPLDCVVIVTDDISLPFGQLRLRAMGSPGGHNGLKSIEHFLGTSNYMRLRMGIGHPGEEMLADYVLETFDQAERKELPAFIDRGVEVLQRLLKEDFSRVMNSVNTVPRQASPEPTTNQATKQKPPVAGLGE